MMGLEGGWEYNLLNVNLEKMRGRQEAEGDSHWGQIEGKRFDALCWYGFREWAPPQLRTEKPMLGLLHQRILMAIEEGWVKIHFQKASHWYFLFTSFSSRLCLCTVLCRTWGEEETGWNRLSLASLFFFAPDSSTSSFITIWISSHFSSCTSFCLPTFSISKTVDCF